ncbi:lasso peptide biosynthesis B2 protein [Rubrivirga sp. S365]|uniref:Lasso peptide biosynthesis B2 protein n=1 Tax=Rubrivirga litoralis TaxID=3075598 RepID=A0ABU3BPM1_9BACT|nr:MULTISPECIES: lasso peptide biosynthesis B2 protein [unclassified Rubrivirga]MDT0631225.1 lasso peptide biosynthesis B2 protein [Rubrivirga sp. F394]MDT7856632.1 lasso peptide biosynthesis B2 protein [Rubrivirga sp. S365]
MPTPKAPDRGPLARTLSAAGRARRLPRASWGALARVLPMLLVVRIALWALPYRTVVRLFEPSAGGAASADKVPPQQASALLRTVAWAGRTLLADRPCLTQAIAGRWLLARKGYPSTLRLGVRRDEDGIGAHAWLEVDGRIVLGGGDSSVVYSPFRPARRRDEVQDALAAEER